MTKEAANEEKHYDLHERVGLSRGECGGELDWAKYVDCDGDDSEPGRYNGIVGISSKTCCATGRPPRFGPNC